MATCLPLCPGCENCTQRKAGFRGARLGTGDDYIVTLTPRDGLSTLAELPFSKLSWTRRLDDSSDSTLSIPLDTSSVDCCGVAGSMRTWGHSIRVHRDGDLVWEGPIVGLDYGRRFLEVTARDVSAWMAFRLIRSILDFRDGADLSQIAKALLEHAFNPDDPNVLPYISISDSGVRGERYYAPGKARYVMDEFVELGRTGIDWTALGRRIVVSGELGFGQLPVLRQEHFLDELRVIEDGLGAATFGQVVGSGVVGEHGGKDDFYGLLERTVSEDPILDQGSADVHAQAIVAAGNPAPLYVVTGGGAQLDCNAPIGINQLVPGVKVPVAVTESEVCRGVSTMMRLESVKVSVGDKGETVGVTLALPGFEGLR